MSRAMDRGQKLEGFVGKPGMDPRTSRTPLCPLMVHVYKVIFAQDFGRQQNSMEEVEV